MAKDHLLYGRQILKEAIAQNLKIEEVFAQNESASRFVESLRLSGSPKIQTKMPPSLKDVDTQGVAFRVKHDFYIADSGVDADRYPFILCCNHLEDAQNLGAITRLAAAFGANLVVHESRRSISVNAAVVKISAGQAFRMSFLEVSNLTPFLVDLKDAGYWLAALEKGESSKELYAWQPAWPLALVVGSEAEGIGAPVRKQVHDFLEIPIDPAVESLNAAQAAGIAMSWIAHHRKLE